MYMKRGKEKMKKYSKKMIKKIKERLDTSNQLKDGVQLALEMGKKIKELTKENIEYYSSF